MKASRRCCRVAICATKLPPNRVRFLPVHFPLDRRILLSRGGFAGPFSDKPILFYDLADLFDMQDEIVARLANQLGAQLIAAEARRAERSDQQTSTIKV